MKHDKYLPETQGVFEKCKRAAQDLKLKSVDIDLFVTVFLSNLGLGCLTIINNQEVLATLLSKSIKRVEKKRKYEYRENIHFTFKLERFLECCEEISLEVFELDYVAPEAIFINLLTPEFAPPVFKEVFYEDGDYTEFADKLIDKVACYLRDEEFEEQNEFEPRNGGVPELFESSESTEPTAEFLDMFAENEILSQFAENLNIKAAEGKFDKVIDFDGKIAELATILCRKKKPNAILVGPAGTGKTSIVEGLASSIVEGKSPELLANKVIYSLSLSNMVAGTQYRGQFEERLENFVNEAKKHENLILFIDEVHTLVGAGGSSENSLEASNMLKPELARGTISCIGATTINEYTNTIKKDSALDRRFERVAVREPSKFQMEKIVPSIVEFYEEFHHVTYSKEFLDNVLDYCERFMPNKCYPDKAVDVIDHCGAQAKVKFWSISEDLQKLKDQVLDETVKESDKLFSEFESQFTDWVSSRDTKPAIVTLKQLKSFFDTKENPLHKDQTLKNFFDNLSKHFVGNNAQIRNLHENIRLSNLGFDDSEGSQAVFCLNGEKFSGKSMFSKLLKECLDIEGANVISFNGVHFSDAHAQYKIIPERLNNTSLCEKVLIHPNSVIIIDDFHKVNPNTYTLFSEIFKDGRLQMPSGEIADFSNCKFFLTSDVTSEKSMGFNGNSGEATSLVSPALSKYFTSNIFLGELNKRDLRRVLWNRLHQMNKNFKMSGVELVFDFKFIKNFVDNIAEEDNKIQSLNDHFEKEVKKRLAPAILKGEKQIFLEKLLTFDKKQRNITT